MTELVLWFAKPQGIPQLERTLFIDPFGNEILAERGKTSRAYRNAGVFQWTPGVKALAVSFLTALVHQLKNAKTYLPLIEGERGSLAASLSYALYKQPEWLFDMFGGDESGNSRLRQLLFHSKLGTGKVAISLNEDLLPPSAIKIYLGTAEIRNVEEIERLAFEIVRDEDSDAPLQIRAPYVIPQRPAILLPYNRAAQPVPLSLSDPDNIYLFEQLQSASQATADRLGLNFIGSNGQPPAVFGRVVQAKHLFEELTYQTCDARTREQFEDWIASMTYERDGEWGIDIQRDGNVLPGFLRWIREQNNFFGSDGLYRTVFWRDRLTGEMVATATIAPDDRDVSSKYQLQGDGHVGGINVRWDLRSRGLGKYVAARMNQHIRDHAKRDGRPKVIHTYNYNFGGIPLPFLQSVGYVQHAIGHVETDFGTLPLWSKEYLAENKVNYSQSLCSV